MADPTNVVDLDAPEDELTEEGTRKKANRPPLEESGPFVAEKKYADPFAGEREPPTDVGGEIARAPGRAAEWIRKRPGTALGLLFPPLMLAGASGDAARKATEPAAPKPSTAGHQGPVDLEQLREIEQRTGTMPPSPREETTLAPSRPTPAAGGGGGGGGGPSPFERQIADDFNERIGAMEDEASARQAASQGVSEAYGRAAGVQRDNAYSSMAQSHANAEEIRAKLAEIEQLNRDYASGHIDKDKVWSGRPLGAFGAALGTMFAGLGGGVGGAMKYYGQMVEEGLGLQREELERKYKAGLEAHNLLGSLMRTSASQQEADDKARAMLWGAAMTEVNEAGAAAKGPEEVAQVRQLIADMKLARDQALQKLKVQRAAAAAATGPGSFIPIEGGATTAQLPDGTTVLVPHGGEQVAASIVGASRAAEEAGELAAHMDRMPNPATSPMEFQQWYHKTGELLKSTAVLGANHLGSGARGSVATMQAYTKAIAGSDTDPTTYAGPVDAAKFTVGGLRESLKANALTFQRTAQEDLARNLQAHNVIPGQVVMTQAKGTGEYKGQTITKPVFVPGAARRAPRPSVQQPGSAAPPSFQPTR